MQTDARTRRKISTYVSKKISWARSKKWDGPLPAADCTTTTMFLLLFHLPENSILLDLNQIAPLILA
jgi:hypothetical protein